MYSMYVNTFNTMLPLPSVTYIPVKQLKTKS